MKTDIEKILEAIGVEVKPYQVSMTHLGGKGYCLFEISNDLNAIRELELMVIEKVGAKLYGMALVMALSIEDEIDFLEVSAMVTADASTRITATLRLWRGNEPGKQVNDG